MKRIYKKKKLKAKNIIKKENYYLMENILKRKDGQEKYINIIKMN